MIRIRLSSKLLAAIVYGVMVVSWQAVAYSQGQKVNWTLQRVDGEWHTECSLDSLSGTTLWFTRDTCRQSVPLDSVAVLFSPDNSHPVIGLLIGAVVGGAAGYLVAPEPYTERHSENLWIFQSQWDETINPAPAYAAAGALLVGGIGLLIGSQGREQVYDLRLLKPEQKITRVSSLIHRKQR